MHQMSCIEHSALCVQDAKIALEHLWPTLLAEAGDAVRKRQKQQKPQRKELDS